MFSAFNFSFYVSNELFNAPRIYYYRRYFGSKNIDIVSFSKLRYRPITSHHLSPYIGIVQKHSRLSRNGERWPNRPYSSSGAGNGVLLHHRAAVAGCASLTVDAAAAHCALDGAAQIRPADSFLHNHCPNSRGFTKVFSNMVFYIVDYHFFTENLFFLPCVLPFVLTV